ncbi:efflux RND transporter permease subunit, partial [candidate division KSB1 bacterium]|nr:efflux RND transporter permease subunit [candidate division KSB1 bacterium]
MQLPKYAIENHQFTLVVIILLILAGITSFIIMPKTEDPPVQPPGCSVIIIYPGASPMDMENLVVEPLEEAINELDDIKEVHSEALDGLASIGVEFEPGSDPDDKYDKFLQKVNATQPELPDGILSLQTIQWTISDVSILQLALCSESAPFRTLEKEAERLKKKIEKIPGVKKVEFWALPQQQVRVDIDLERLAQRRISLQRVVGAIQDANTNIPGGHVESGGRRLTIKTSGNYPSLDALRHTVIAAAPGAVVYLKDLASVSLQYEDAMHLARYNGRRGIYITVSQKPNTNIFTIFSYLRPQIETFSRELPPHITVETAFDQSQSVSSRINGFFINLLQGLLLVGLVVLIAIGLRASVIVMLAIPISSLIGIAFLYYSGYGIQQMTIAGLVIALGLLVDNAIVVTQNSSRFMRMGLP